MTGSVFHRIAPLFLALLAGASYVCLQRTGPSGLVLLLALWLLSLPLVLRPLSEGLRREWAGVAFLFLVASYSETLDGLFEWGQRVSLITLGIGLCYLWQRRQVASSALRSPLLLFAGAFLLQQVLSAIVLNPENVAAVFENRASMWLTLLCTAILVRQPTGRAIVPAVIVMAALMSVPVMLREVADAQQTGLSSALPLSAGRAGGFYDQANNAGAVLTFALAFALALFLQRALPGPMLLVIAVALGAGVLTTLSRGGLLTFGAVLLAGWLLSVRQRTRSGAALFAGIAATATLLAMAASLIGWPTVSSYVEPAGQALAREVRNVEALGVPDASRLEDLVLALFGSSDRLSGDDSGRGDLVTLALQMVSERPLFGWGTGNFVVTDDPRTHALRSHVQFIDVLGENGVAGGLMYGGVLLALLLALFRMPPRLRHGCYLLCGAWLMTHAFNHSLWEFRFLTLPLAYACGLNGPRTSECESFIASPISTEGAPNVSSAT